MSVSTTSTSWTNGMSAVLRRLVVRRLPLLAGLALLFRGELRAVLVADVAEPRAPRHVLAALDAAAHVQAAPAASGAREPGGALVRLRAFREDAFLFPDGNAARVVAAEPAVSRPRSLVLATRRGTHPDVDRAPATTARRGAREHLFRARGDGGCKLLDQTVQHSVDGFGHSAFRLVGSTSGRCG